MIERERRFFGKGVALPPKKWADYVGNFLRDLKIELWDKTYAEVDRPNANGMGTTIRIPSAAAFAIKGTKQLYMVVSCREWLDVDGVLTETAIGAEGSDPANLYPTWDWVRAH